MASGYLVDKLSFQGPVLKRELHKAQAQIRVYKDASTGRTLLHVAAEKGLLAAVKELLQLLGSKACDAVDNQGNLPLHLAAAQGFTEVVSELLAACASRKTTILKKKNKAAYTPLHLAALHAQQEVVTQLLEAGARNDVKDMDGFLPSQLVPPSASNHTQLVAALTGGADLRVAPPLAPPLPSEHSPTCSPASSIPSPSSIPTHPQAAEPSAGAQPGQQTLTSRLSAPATSSGGGSSSIPSARLGSSTGADPGPRMRSSGGGAETTRQLPTAPRTFTGASGAETARASLNGLPSITLQPHGSGTLPMGTASGAQAAVPGAGRMTPPHADRGAAAGGRWGAPSALPSSYARQAELLRQSHDGAPGSASSTPGQGVASQGVASGRGPAAGGGGGGGAGPPPASGRPNMRASTTSLEQGQLPKFTRTPSGSQQTRQRSTSVTPGPRTGATPRHTARTPTGGYADNKTPQSNGTHMHTPAGGFSPAPGFTPQQLVADPGMVSQVSELRQMVEALSARLGQFEEQAEVATLGRREVEEQLLQAQAMVKEQAERLDDVEARFQDATTRCELAEAKCGAVEGLLAAAQARLEQAEVRVQEASQVLGQQRGKQELALRDVDQRLQQLQTDVVGLQQGVAKASRQQQTDHEAVSTQVAQLMQQVKQADTERVSSHASLQEQLHSMSTDRGAPMPSPAASTAPPVPLAPGAFSDRQFQQAAAAEQLEAQLGELQAALQVVSSRAVGHADLDALRARLSKLEALGVSDKLQLLQLHTQQLSSSLASLSTQHSEVEEKLSVLQRWQAEAVAGQPLGLHASMSSMHSQAKGAGAQGDRMSPGGRASSNAGLDAAGLLQLHSQVAALDGQAKDTQQQLQALKEQVSQLSTAAPQAPATPSQAQPQQQQQQQAPMTPCSSARRTPGGSGLIGAAASSAAVEALESLQTGMEEVHRDIALLKSGVEELRTEVNVTAGSLRREWSDAVAEAGRRYAEQSAELSQREARVKAMRESMFAESDSRHLVQQLEQRVTRELDEVDTRLGLLQHKVELVEDQLQGGLAAGGMDEAGHDQ